MILDDAVAVADAASWRALDAALDRYRDAARDLLEVTQMAGSAGSDYAAARALVHAARDEVRTCWALHFGEPPQWR